MSFTGTLRPYQIEPVQRLKDERTVLLAAEQGTGKTPITINAIEDQFDSLDIVEPGLWVTLSTLTYQTAAAIQQFTSGSSRTMIIPSGSDSTYTQRCDLYARARDWEVDYIILSYEAVKNDWSEVIRLPRSFMVVDEVSFIRGFRSDRAASIKQLSRNVPVKYGLTGTPIENGKPEEFYSIFEFIDPGLFGRWDIFDRTFIKRNKNGWPERYTNLPTFHALVATKMVRLLATDPDVAPYMPAKNDGEPIIVPFDPVTAGLYDAIAADLLRELEEASKWGHDFDLSASYGRSAKKHSPADRAKGRIGQRLQALLMLCDHPELLRISAEKFVNTKTAGNGYIAALREAGVLDSIDATPKRNALIAWLQQRLADSPDNKVVVFTRFVDMIHLIGMCLPKEQWASYSGRMSAKIKDQHLTTFQTDPGCRLLISSDAGGFGLDIPQANYSINYDLPDGAGAADQRDTRIVRTSSEFASVSRNWIFMEGSIEERNWARINQKRAVSRAFIDNKGISAKGNVDLTVKTLTKFLKDTGIKSGNR